jgi:CheY-like chemotaxis protein
MIGKGIRRTAIVMAEDDPQYRILSEEAMREAAGETELVFVDDGQKLLDYLHRACEEKSRSRKGLPSLIILDLNLPKKSGREALREIKENPEFRKIPVVVLTTSSSEDVIRDCYDLGVNGYITKPARDKDLIDVMRVVAKYWLKTVELPFVY